MSGNKADLILSGNKIFTGLTDELISGSIVIKNKKIIAVCSKQESEKYINGNTKVLEYDDKLIMPGFHDFHAHVFLGGLYEYCVSLDGIKSEEEAVESVRDFASEQPDLPWILGFKWHYMDWDEKRLPTRHSLDKFIPDRPVMLINSALHSAWLNTKALKILGIDENTKAPPYGVIEKDDDGKPTGLLIESAISLAVNEAFNLPKEKEKEILLNFLNEASKLGVTSISDMFPLPGFELGNVNLYHELEEEGKLSSRIHFLSTLDEDLSIAKNYRSKFETDKIRFSGLKSFLDGVPSLYTAFLLEPYSNNPKVKGYSFIEEEKLKSWVTEADKEGFRIRLHACGDAAVRLALDSFQFAENVNGKRDSRHTIEHVELIHPNDISRFSELGVIASMQPEHMAFSGSFVNNTFESYFGSERTQYGFPIKSLSNSGAKIAFGSDYPVVGLNPLLEIHRAVSRMFNDGKPKDGWIPDEKITLTEALSFYTLGSAYGNFVDESLGTIAVGKFADVIVLDRNLFDIPINDIPNAIVKLTLVDGDIVYENKDCL